MIINLPKGFLLWLLFPLCACSFLGWVNHRRLQRVDYVSALAGHATLLEKTATASPSGYALGLRELIVPERNEESIAWITQTQQMAAQQQGRIRHVDYENAPFGCEVNAPSVFRWWLGFIAWVDHFVTHRPFGAAVERAALYANPVLHGLVLVSATLFVAWRFGFFVAALLAVGLTTFFPWAAGFLPAVPDHFGLARACAFGSVLLVLAGLRDALQPRRWFILAGMVGGLGVWVDVRIQIPILAGIVLGALTAVVITKKAITALQPTSPLAQFGRTWALSGAATVLAAYLLEYCPSHLGEWRLESIHPLYGLAWLGAGEVFAQAIAWSKRGRPSLNLGHGLTGLFALAAIAAVPVATKWSGGEGFFAPNLSTIRLTNEPAGIVSTSFKTWLCRDGLNTTVVCTLLPLLVLIPAGWRLLRRQTNPNFRIGLATALGPVLVALGYASQQLSWWSLLDGLLLVLLVTAASESQADDIRPVRWVSSAVTAIVVVPGLIHLWPGKKADTETVLAPSEAQELVERHLAYWLAKRTEKSGAVIYAPPHQTTSLCFFGGFRGIGTFSPENRAGFGATLTIAAANTVEEAQTLIESREVRYLVVPSWDLFFDEFAHLYLDQRQSRRTSILISRLRHLDLPLWLRPLPYVMPEIGGFENQTVFVFEVVENQKPAVAASRLSEFLVETGKIPQALLASKELEKFPGDVSALAARAQVCSASEDATAFAKTTEDLLSRLANGGDRFLPWDRRVSLATVLAQADQIDLARVQVQRCIKEIDAGKVRTLSTGALYRLLVLSHALKIEISDSTVHDLALDLLPSDLRGQL